ncbi:hypothetical protein MMYC01_202627 [Madurella mycetomatis]|uniref:Uncharacterized protein n=1 Tax=Madurella mycetomatis TaxID=100816 RepID=A0A175W0B6_9PEZI|nr:hypothetical protein MMYC01_205805 [Madurella mycetomatis]KXX80538.1 hypothetical protein MMYC01_202627 [Madurella mycetomatis]
MAKDKVPDAWDDDDWEVQADRMAKEEPPKPEPQVPMTRAERLAKHAEEQRKLWELAETREELPFLPSTNSVPLATPFKPAVKLLSRKPAPQMIARRDPVTGLEKLTLQDDEEDEGAEKKKQETPEEIRKRQQRELEEKQRRYEEARAKIFGDSNPSSGQSTPGNVTPPWGSDGRQNRRGRGRGGRGGGRGRDRDRDSDNGRQERTQQGIPQSNGTRELYDPGYAPKPGFHIQKRGDAPPQLADRSATPHEEDQVIRPPRGPDGSGRGFGFARRGAKES